MVRIAALFVQPDGCYAGLSDVDVWDEGRDARTYDGPFSVVAHPPCQRWGALAAVNYVRWGGEHNKPGNDGGCFASALRSVIAYGGVLEHPAKSKVFSSYGLPEPKGLEKQPGSTTAVLIRHMNYCGTAALERTRLDFPTDEGNNGINRRSGNGKRTPLRWRFGMSC